MVHCPGLSAEEFVFKGHSGLAVWIRGCGSWVEGLGMMGEGWQLSDLRLAGAQSLLTRATGATQGKRETTPATEREE